MLGHRPILSSGENLSKILDTPQSVSWLSTSSYDPSADNAIPIAKYAMRCIKDLGQILS